MTMQSAPSLPSVFRGCWEAQVDSVDELEPLPGGHKVGYWTPKTYRLCYKRVGEGPFALTLTEAGVTPNMQITNVRSRINPVATDGRTRAKLRSDLHFDEFNVTRGMRDTTFAVDEVAMLDCAIDGEDMSVNATVHGTRDGEPWFRARWHADFRHIPR